MIRSFALVICSLAILQGKANAEIITGLFDFRNQTMADTPVLAPIVLDVVGTDATFRFSLSITSGANTVIQRGGFGGIGVDSGVGLSSIDQLGEDLTLALSVSVINPTGSNIVPSELTFRSETLNFVNDAGFDSGSFGSFSPAGPGNPVPGPGSPDIGPITSYTWSGNSVAAFNGMTVGPMDDPSFDLFLMNGGPTTTFVQTFRSGSFVLGEIQVSVVAAPEPSSLFLGAVAGVVGAGAFVRRRRRISAKAA